MRLLCLDDCCCGGNSSSRRSAGTHAPLLGDGKVSTGEAPHDSRDIRRGTLQTSINGTSPPPPPATLAATGDDDSSGTGSDAMAAAGGMMHESRSRRVSDADAEEAIDAAWLRGQN
eukprot:COSAG06_NODE_18235_length_897_cov_0.911028_1_plen_115_part_01